MNHRAPSGSAGNRGRREANSHQGYRSFTGEMAAERKVAKALTVAVLVFVAPFVSAAASGAGGEQGARAGTAAVVSWPAPKGEQLFEDYRLRINGTEVPVYVCRVSAMPFNQVWPGYQRPTEQTELAGFAYWGMRGPVAVEVISKRPFKSVAVRPRSRGIRPSLKGNTIRFRLARPGQFTVELDGPHHALHLFADPPEADAPPAGGPSVMYFGPGVHRPGAIDLKSGQTIYVAGGAVVYTSIHGRGVDHVRVLGRGIIDTSEFERGKGGGSIRLTDCSDVKVDGVILRDPDVWGLSAFGCRNVAVSRVKLVGLWRYNSDGIDMCNTENVTVRDSFIRSYDDSLVLKGLKGRSGGAGPSYDGRPVRNIRASGLVIWCDWGRALEIGAETCAPEISDVIFRDIDVIRTTHIGMDIQHGDRAAVHDIRFEDVRVEVDDVNPPPLLQKAPGEQYRPDPRAAYLPQLFVIVIQKTFYSKDEERGTVRDVLFKDVAVTGRRMPPSSFTGLDAGHDVRGVTIQNLRFNGKRIANAGAARFEIGRHVSGVHFGEPGEAGSAGAGSLKRP